MRIAAMKLLERKANGSISEVISVPDFEISDDFYVSLFNVHLSEGNGKPNFQKIEGETDIISFYSGNKDVFMVEPNYVLILIPDGAWDEKDFIRVSRILINNVLIHLHDPNLEQYITGVLQKIETEGIASLTIEKKQDIAPEPQPKPEIQAPSASTSASDEFSDLEELVGEMEDEDVGADVFPTSKPVNASDPFGISSVSDPFGGSSSSDPFGGGSSSANPFGGAASSDPFGGSSADPFGGSSRQDTQINIDHDLFKEFDPKTGFKDGSDDVAFSSNPWATKDKKAKKDDEIDPFSENPFG